MLMRVHMKKLALQVYIDLQKRTGATVLHFIHIRKTAGTAIRQTISRKAKYSGKVLSSGGFLIQAHGHEFTLQDVKPGEKAFFVVRDPIQRFISGFYSRKRMGKPQNYNPWTEGEQKAFTWFENPDQLGLALASEADRSKAVFALRHIKHVNSSYYDWFINDAYLRENLDKILFVLCQEDLDADFIRAQAAHNIQLGALIKDPKRAHKNPTAVKKELSEESRKQLMDWFQPEYQFLNLLHTCGLINRTYE